MGDIGGRVLIAVPAWNEADTVGQVIAELNTAAPDADILVVDDGSTDETFEVARAAGAQAVQLPFNVGVGGAMRTAFLYATRGNYDAVVQVDADGQHSPEFVSALIGELARRDVVIGSRFHNDDSYPVRGPRRWAMTVLAFTLSRVTRTHLTDTTSGFRAAGPRAIDLFSRHYPAEYLGDTIDSIVLAARAGLSIGEIPVTMKTRQGGAPSQGAVRSTAYLGRPFLALFVAVTRRRTTDGNGV